jgi:hypothetical protein
MVNANSIEEITEILIGHVHIYLFITCKKTMPTYKSLVWTSVSLVTTSKCRAYVQAQQILLPFMENKVT